MTTGQTNSIEFVIGHFVVVSTPDNNHLKFLRITTTSNSLRHPRRCRYFQEYKYCKFGEYCKFNHEEFEDDTEITEIKKKLEELKREINAKDEEIKLKNN